jgi:hypothetical protein
VSRTKQTAESKQCQGVRVDGTPCSKFAVHDPEVLARYPEREGNYCLLHLSPEGWREVSEKGGRETAARARARKGPKPRSGLQPGLSYDDVLVIAREGLEATFPHDSSPDWGARLLGVLAIVHSFQLKERRTAEQVRSLLDRVLPEGDPLRRTSPDTLYANGRKEWERLKVRDEGSELPKLYAVETPAFLVAPWAESL